MKHHCAPTLSLDIMKEHGILETCKEYLHQGLQPRPQTETNCTAAHRHSHGPQPEAHQSAHHDLTWSEDHTANSFRASKSSKSCHQEHWIDSFMSCSLKLHVSFLEPSLNAIAAAICYLSDALFLLNSKSPKYATQHTQRKKNHWWNKPDWQSIYENIPYHCHPLPEKTNVPIDPMLHLLCKPWGAESW